MLRFFQMLIDAVLPRKERVMRLDSYALEDLKIAPETHEAHGIEITTLLSYRTKAVEDLVRALKYDRAGNAAELLSSALAEYLREEIASVKMYSVKPVILVPVPLHASRIAERGFNQVERILGKMPREFHDGTLSLISPDVLVRTRATPQQTRLSRTERLKNVSGAFALGEAAHDSRIFLIDDVTTTGATLAEAARTLQSLGTPISAIALAHA